MKRLALPNLRGGNDISRFNTAFFNEDNDKREEHVGQIRLACNVLVGNAYASVKYPRYAFPLRRDCEKTKQSNA